MWVLVVTKDGLFLPFLLHSEAKHKHGVEDCMVSFSIKIAGKVAAVHAFFESSKDYCKAYLISQAPDFTVTISQEDLVMEKEKAAQTDRAEGKTVRDVTDAQLEITAIQRKIAQELVDHDTVLFHGSVVAVDGCAYLFTAKSGTGKSTHTRLWREVFGPRAVMVNDDKPFLLVTQQGILACGSPWNGKHRLGANMEVPLKGICILERGAENHITTMDPQDALYMLLQQSNRPGGAKRLGKYLELVDRIAASVPIYRLRCNMEPEAAMVSYRAMAKCE
jgi:hypothetical protein